uniref:Uncharacterized protein n=2 Tax=Caenorhabditis japonica TaxID=281687 RepID=A0A8R1ESA3_CAEJA
MPTQIKIVITSPECTSPSQFADGMVKLQVNPVLEELNRAFNEFSHVVKARPSPSTAALLENIRQELMRYVNVVTLHMNIGNVVGLLNHLIDGQHTTKKIKLATERVRVENAIRGFTGDK